MKKLLVAIAFCALCFASHAQDSEKEKAKNRKEVKAKAKKISKAADNKTDSIVKKVYPKAHKVKP